MPYLFLLNSSDFSIGPSRDLINVVFLPIQAQKFWAVSPALAIGIIAVATGFTQMFTPIVGVWSDAYQSHYGRRRIFLTVAQLMNTSGLAMMWFAVVRRKRAIKKLKKRKNEYTKQHENPNILKCRFNHINMFQMCLIFDFLILRRAI